MLKFLPDVSIEAVLPPGFINSHRNGVGKVQAALAGLHGYL